MIERKLNYRPTFEINMTEPVAQNYHPVTTAITVQDAAQQLAVLVDRAQGGAALQEGCLELMVHRRLLDDDAFGVGEALNEEAYGAGLVAAGTHTLVLGADQQSFSAEVRRRAVELYNQPLLIFGDIELGQNFPQLPQLAAELPGNVHLLTLRSIADKADPGGRYLFLQLEHIFEAEEHDTLSKPVTIDLETLFLSSSVAVESFRETTLGGNLWVEDVERLRFMKDSNEIPPLKTDRTEPSQWAITLDPMEIRSFIIKFN